MTDLRPSHTVHIDSEQSDGAMPVATTGREGTEFVLASNNLCDKLTWWHNSVRYDDQACSEVAPNDGTTWEPDSNNVPWVDLTHGRVYNEDKIRAEGPTGNYEIVVKVDSVVMTEDPKYGDIQDYSIDYATGTITFTTSQAGKTVTVSYNHAIDSVWKMIPKTSKKLIIEEAEVQFSGDISFDAGIKMSVWGWVQVFAPTAWDGYDPPGPLATNTLVELRQERYLTVDQIIDSARGSYPTIPVMAGPGGTATTRNGFPFRYGTVSAIQSQYGMELHIEIEGHVAFGGERGTVTFYGVVASDP